MDAPQRLHSLDAVRAFALLLGIVLHATMSFFLPVPAADSSQSTALGIGFYAIHIFRMSLFYLIAGFFARMLLHRRGMRRFVRDRARRILIPMTAGWLVLAPITIVVVVWGVGRTFADAPQPAPPEQAEGFPLIHLWFLYYLGIFYLLALAVRELAARFPDRGGSLRRGVDGAVRAVLRSRLAPVLLAVPLFAVLYADGAWPVWFGIPTPDTGLVPQLPALVGFGTAFSFGWLLHRQSGLITGFERGWAAHLGLAVGLTAVCLSIVGPSPDIADPSAIEGPAWQRLAYAACYTIAIWCWIFGILGAGLKFCAGESPLRRYLADASYWLYLMHLPLIFFLQVLVMDWPLHWSLKFPLILAVATTALLASYHYWVRSTFIGEILNGRRYPRGIPRAAGGDSPRSANPTAVSGGAVAALEGVSKRYGDTLALDGLDLELGQGELLALLGPNGAGKTTAISLWLGLLTPDSGTVRLAHGSPFETENRLGTGVMMQDVHLPPELKAREIVALAGSYYPDPLSVDETLGLTGTTALADRRYKQMSSGQKRQVQFSVAVCGRPRLLFLDEPTVGLDVQARERMWQTIRTLVAHGCSIVLTTHYLEEAEALADRVAVLAKGRLIADGSVDEIRRVVSRRQIRCATCVDVADIRQWPGVVEVTPKAGLLEITAVDAEAVVRRLLALDETLGRLEVKQASLADAFAEITKEAA